MYEYILVLIVICAIIYYYFFPDVNIFNTKTKEDFAMYVEQPFGDVKTGSLPMGYYQKNAYRLPFRYPMKFYSSYPVPYMKHYENL
jgi:hypothetical protein